MKPIVMQMRRRPFNPYVLRRSVRRVFHYHRGATESRRGHMRGLQFHDASLNPTEIAAGDMRRLRPSKYSGATIFGAIFHGIVGPVRRMIVEESPQFRRLDAFSAAQSLEERRHLARIVSGARQNLRGERAG